jgi:hypothetical protein
LLFQILKETIALVDFPFRKESAKDGDRDERILFHVQAEFFQSFALRDRVKKTVIVFLLFRA